MLCFCSVSPGNASHSNIGAIVGGAVGGVCGFLAVLSLGGLYLWRRRRAHLKAHPIDLLRSPSDEGGGEQLPLYYKPDPFVLPQTSATSTPSNHTMSERTGNSSADFLMAGRPETPSAASSGRTGKSAAPPSLVPVNFVQHEDAGPPPEDEPEQEPETVELPPAYANLKRAPLPPADDDESPPTPGGSAHAY